MKSESLEATEAECAQGRTAPRVSLQDIERQMGVVMFATADKMIPSDNPYTPALYSALEVLTICTVVMFNGFIILGKSAPASAANYNKELGEKLAYEDAVRQIWPLMGFALKDRLHRAEAETPIDPPAHEPPNTEYVTD